ncbi:hypothetical protein LTR37_012133 [Vermiconidia calcicola]|uniref:Uncharacterized protein n=1 Tax=Vermiconidia calcicola TaxID=1690605 RepID=A0ACC3N071_9PEZI|nr:hypothetical protein LTR37_012133 [Vermiconidia calcicola]
MMAGKRFSNLDLVDACDNFSYEEEAYGQLYQLYLPDDQPYGYLWPEVVKRMPWTDDFAVDDERRRVTVLDASNGSDVSSACNAAFAKLINDTIDKDIFACLHKKHSEPFPILGAKYPVRFERFAGDLFGITARGAHLTVYTMTEEGMRIWVPRRHPNMFTYPNKLDTTVAGGVSADESPAQNIIREAHEEASLPADLIEHGIRSTGVLTYMSQEKGTPDGKETYIVPDVIYVYDLEVGPDITPVPGDEEVKEFYLMSVDEVKDALSRGEFKTNSAVVMLDFFIRHGMITADNEKDYVDIVTRMHRRLPFPTSA